MEARPYAGFIECPSRLGRRLELLKAHLRIPQRLLIAMTQSICCSLAL